MLTPDDLSVSESSDNQWGRERSTRITVKINMAKHETLWANENVERWGNRLTARQREDDAGLV
jgi:hypothetical protein